MSNTYEFFNISDLPENEQEPFEKWLKFSNGEYLRRWYDAWKAHLNKILRECFDGWNGLIDEAEKELLQIGVEYRHYRQIKQKLGGLRIYIDTQHLPEDAQKKAREIVEKYIKLAASTCEYCGDDGILLSHSGCIRTICKNCDQKIFGTDDI